MKYYFKLILLLFSGIVIGIVIAQSFNVAGMLFNEGQSYHVVSSTLSSAARAAAKGNTNNVIAALSELQCEINEKKSIVGGCLACWDIFIDLHNTNKIEITDTTCKEERF